MRKLEPANCFTKQQKKLAGTAQSVVDNANVAGDCAGDVGNSYRLTSN